MGWMLKHDMWGMLEHDKLLNVHAQQCIMNALALKIMIYTFLIRECMTENARPLVARPDTAWPDMVWTDIA